jgi:hypothetical protein
MFSGQKTRVDIELLTYLAIIGLCIGSYFRV